MKRVYFIRCTCVAVPCKDEMAFDVTWVEYTPHDIALLLNAPLVICRSTEHIAEKVNSFFASYADDVRPFVADLLLWIAPTHPTLTYDRMLKAIDIAYAWSAGDRGNVLRGSEDLVSRYKRLGPLQRRETVTFNPVGDYWTLTKTRR